MRRKRLICYLILVFSVITFFKILFHVHVDITDEKFLNLDLCPACYGNNLCPHFFHGEISLIGLSKFEYLNILNSKNVYSGKFNGDRVILKKLAHNWELLDRDSLLCDKAKLVQPCKVKNALELLIRNCLESENKINLLSLFNSLDSKTDIAHCPSERLLLYLLGRIFTTYSNVSSNEQSFLHKVGEIMYGLNVNPEAVILQAFSQAEGWPFPHYYGSCGRIIVEEYVGRTLSHFEDAPWKQRIDISYQLLLIAQTLTENFSRFAFYMTDVNMDNFAVRSDGTVLLIDVEGIVIVDQLKNNASEKLLHESKGEFCKDCLNFSYEDLCNSDVSDHNYYAICKGLLIPDSYYSSKGLLHDIPDNIIASSNLSALVQECANPSRNLGRFHVVPKILQVMKSLL